MNERPDCRSGLFFCKEMEGASVSCESFKNGENPTGIFFQERERLNQQILMNAGMVTKRFMSLDHQVYRPGAVNQKTKELLGLVASLVLRCDDCITYHLQQCHHCGVSTEELEESMSIGLIVGGSIVIPHLRKAYDFWNRLQTR